MTAHFFPNSKTVEPRGGERAAGGVPAVQVLPVTWSSLVAWAGPPRVPSPSATGLDQIIAKVLSSPHISSSMEDLQDNICFSFNKSFLFSCTVKSL